jgi:hypothetical protein
MATVQGTDSNGEYKVEGTVLILEDEVLRSDPAETQATRGDLLRRPADSLSDSRSRPVDPHDVAPRDPRGDGTRRRARAASDVKHPHVRSKRKRVHDRGKPRRQPCNHGATLHTEAVAPRALLRWCRQTVLGPGSPAVGYWSEDQGQLVECYADPILHGQVGADREVAAAQVLHEGMSGRDGVRRR